MSSMYKIPPLVPDDFDVKPIDIMYSIPSYHASASQKGSDAACNGFLEEQNDPVKAIEMKQQNLIKSIKDLGSTLEALLQEMGKCASGPSAAKKTRLDESVAPAPDTSAKSGSKKDKDAKKEARKAAKSEAKSKATSGAVSSADKPSKGESGHAWVIHEDKRSTETGQSLTACLPSAFTDFEIEKLGDVTMAATETDRPWIEAFSRVGEKRNMAFKGGVSNSCSNPSTTVNISFGGLFFHELLFCSGSGVVDTSFLPERFSVIASGTTLTCRVSAWKLLGSGLGLFSFKPNHSMHATNQHRWLSKVDLVLAGKLSKDDVIREASKFLSQFDALGSQFDFGVADVITKSVLIGESPIRLPNNVELWSKRMDSVM
ncbi:hypothetical protein Y032_0177g582 [Ancylostoma ceylanicum]|uniref:Uncharacterized protein n=1 Tax=Ancylostoma ceylanicum TaxID=53326 RepID=A0A016STQ3_9BILA|nr:hypothetical protein Y032_0177g582 [Ancylostoma ceylanicum]